MRVLVVSDSHGMIGRLGNILMAAEAEGPLDAVIHLGDGYCDLDEFAQNGLPPRYQVAGNCDCGRVPIDYPEILLEDISGVRIYMTHGHRQGVKFFLSKLVADGQRCCANVILYGHTHEADCRRLEDGCWIMNPGSAGYGFSAGIIQINGKDAITCKLVRPSDLEE